jgi:hypothetical protein
MLMCIDFGFRGNLITPLTHLLRMLFLVVILDLSKTVIESLTVHLTQFLAH